MTYSLIIEQYCADAKYVNDIKTWKEVTDFLKNQLSQLTTCVHIFKFSSNSKTLGSKVVTMGNLFDVCNSLTDKILL